MQFYSVQHRDCFVPRNDVVVIVEHWNYVPVFGFCSGPVRVLGTSEHEHGTCYDHHILYGWVLKFKTGIKLYKNG
jgi:hypothetical protein